MDSACGPHTGFPPYSLLHPFLCQGLWELHHTVEGQSITWYLPPPFPLSVKTLPLFPMDESTCFSEPLLSHWLILILII